MVEGEGWQRVRGGRVEWWRVRSGTGKHKMNLGAFNNIYPHRRTHSATLLTCFVTWFLPSKVLNHLSGCESYLLNSLAISGQMYPNFSCGVCSEIGSESTHSTENEDRSQTSQEDTTHLNGLSGLQRLLRRNADFSFS